MGLGLIPVVGDIPGVRKWVDEQSGFLFDLDDRASLRTAMERILESDDNLEPMRERNKERVRNEAVFENNIERTIEIMRELVTRHTP
jgi:glycosyltransferase involved in cell wall biosynthesis